MIPGESSKYNNTHIEIYQTVYQLFPFINFMLYLFNLSLNMEKSDEPAAEKHPLETIIGQKTKFITNDGRVFVGLLKGLDQALNCIIT
jgi:hypothetical protein